jgi:inosine-uridine nucleoside N-ribohydrolase
LEWNASGDPHATAIVYRANVRQHRSIGLDVTTRVSMGADEFREKFRRMDLFRPVLDFAEIWFQHWKGTTFHDPLAAATIFDDQICTFQKGTVEVEIIGEKSKGMVFWHAGDEKAKHEIALEVNSARFFEHFFSVFH